VETPPRLLSFHVSRAPSQKGKVLMSRISRRLGLDSKVVVTPLLPPWQNVPDPRPPFLDSLNPEILLNSPLVPELSAESDLIELSRNWSPILISHTDRDVSRFHVLLLLPSVDSGSFSTPRSSPYAGRHRHPSF